MDSFWINLGCFFCQTKLILPNLDPCQHLLTSVASSFDPLLLNYDFQRTEEGYSDVASLVVYVDGGKPISFLFKN